VGSTRRGRCIRHTLNLTAKALLFSDVHSVAVIRRYRIQCRVACTV
jgi:hypothetical protein